MSNEIRIDPRILEMASRVTAKRPRVVIEHIIRYGFVTTEQLLDLGYAHGPRAARDVKDQGIPLEKIMVPSREGRLIAAYSFGSADSIQADKIGGRKAIPKRIKTSLLELGTKCNCCVATYTPQALQIDHRVPYEVAGESGSELGHKAADFMLLCGSCNRKKSWSCEHCDNWINAKDKSTCSTCYWAAPEGYQHIAGIAERKIELVFRGEELADFSQLQDQAKAEGSSLPELLKDRLKKSIRR